MAGCGFSCAKYTLFFFNAIFWLIGAGILAIGIWIAVDPNLLEYLKLGDFDKADQELKYAAYFLIAAGGAIFIIGFCGCCGAIRESQCLLGFYIVCMLCIIGLEIAAGVYAYLKRDELIKKVEDALQKGITDDYDGKNALSVAWHKFMIEFNCCGVDGPEDWGNAAKWTTAPTYTSATGASQNEYVPRACCVLEKDDHEDPKPKDNQKCQDDVVEVAADTTYASTQLRTKGCSDSLKEWLRSKAVILIAIGFGVAAFELLILILALVVCCQIRRKE